MRPARNLVFAALVAVGAGAVLLQRYSAAGTPQLAQPTDVSRQPATFSWLPRLAFAPDAPRKRTAAPPTAAGLSRRRG